MINPISSKNKNLSLEGFKLLASLFVIFLHVPFDGKIGTTVDAMSRFAVPFFFIISGFFSFHISLQTIVRRIKHILQLCILSSLLYFFRYSFMFLSFGESVITYCKSVFSLPQLLGWILFNLNPIAEHLWFLFALCYCYALFWLYSAITGTKSKYLFLYILGFIILFITLALDGPISRYIIYIPHYIYRNAWFMGFSAFILGIFIRDIFQRYPQLLQVSSEYQILIIAVGFLLAIIQKHTIGTSEISFGALVTASGLMIFGHTHPDCFCKNATSRKFCAKAGSYSTMIYIVHILFIEIYDAHCVTPISNLLGPIESFLRPFLIFLFSLLAAIVYEKAVSYIKRNK